VSADELVGLKPVKDKTTPQTARLLKRLQRIELLSPADRRAVLKYLDTLVDGRGKNGLWSTAQALIAFVEASFLPLPFPIRRSVDERTRQAR
jgi:hypothetical protein